jgi:fucose 4-O-acetylase-like acetyltransferase
VEESVDSPQIANIEAAAISIHHMALSSSQSILRPMAPRSYYIDRIRVILTALVVLHHTAITYGAPGGWYYRELPTSATLTGILFIAFVSLNQAYFMGFFFLLAGYFTPGAYQRKGPSRFLLDRLVRLGIPLLFFAALLDPLTVAITLAWGRPPSTALPFWSFFTRRILSLQWGNGPLWFAQALLIFSLGYIAWSQWRGTRDRRPEAPMPSQLSWLVSALAVGAGALLIRQWIPVGVNVAGLQLGYFSSYVFLFAIGCAAWQRNWLERLPWKTARGWLIVSVCCSPLLVLVALVEGAFKGKPANFAGGLSFPAIFYAFWEPFVAWGIIATYIVRFRERHNQPSPLWEPLGVRAYTVYIIHPPILVGISVALRSWQAPAFAKFAVVGPLTLAACVAVSSLILLVPGIRRIV